MQRIALLTGIAVLAVACTTLRPIEAPREDLQRQILSEALLKPGDRVRIVTTDGTAHEFRVARIDGDEGLVVGEGQSVRVADIAAVEKREVSALKTALLAGAVFLGGLLTADCEDDCGDSPFREGCCA